MALTGPNASSYLANNLLDLPYTVQVQNGAGTQASLTQYNYDETARISSGVSQQHDSVPPSGNYRGNPTSVHRWLNGSTTATTPCNVSVSNGYLVSNNVFYDTGEVQQSTDPCSFPTTYQYSGTYYGAFPTTVSNALGQNTNYGYDFNSGSVTSIVDPNQQPTSKTYDEMNRLTGISYPDGGSTSYCYTDGVANTCGLSGASFSVVETKAITSSPAVNEISTVQVDGLGRMSQTALSTDPGGVDYTLTTYDALGRTSQHYNPSRCSPITTNCGTPIWGYTTTNYDALNRVTSVVEQDGSKVTYAYDQTNAKNTGLCSTVTDEAGSSRQSCVDGLGRLTGVWENPSGLNYETDYTYDALSNLTNVSQKGSNSANARVRAFGYDSLSRLSSATNPESGQILYAYDADGNVIVKTAPLPNQTSTATVTTTRAYDKLNRVTNTVYSDGITPSNFYIYDVAPGGTANLTNIVGRLVTSGNQYAGGTSGKATANYFSYDAMGRVIRNWQQTPSVSPNGAWVCTSYDLAGNFASITPPGQVLWGADPNCDPKGVTISYTHDGANRIATVTSSWSDAQHPAALYSVDPTYGYWAQGGLRKAYFGNNLTESHAYNNRLQPCRASVNTTSAFLAFCTDPTPAGNILDFTVGYNAGSSDNGNVAAWSAVGNQTFTRSYAYDALNRLQSMSDSATNQPCQGMSVTVDAWGNMTNETGTKGTCYNFSSAVGTKNQLQTGYQYDAAGNMTYDGTNSYTYDAENRVTQVNSGSTLSDIYDEFGKRARKTIGSTFTEYYYAPDGNVQIEYNGSSWPTQYVYAGGKLVAEYTNSTTEFVHTDHLGSTRLVTVMNQSVIDSIDYNPFGQLIAGGSSTTHLFTGKERDEGLLTDFGARYYRPLMGRFMTPDWDDGLDDGPESLPDSYLHNPQTLNLYAYVRNNPLNRVDPDGHKMTCTTDADGNMKCTVTEDPYPPDYIGFGTLLNLLFVQPVEALYRSVNPPNCPRCLSTDWALGNVRPLMPRPAGRPAIVPKNWIEKSTPKDNGKIYIDPQNEHNRVRVMDDGYMKVQKNGQYLDVDGNVIPGPNARATAAAHIPVNATMQSPFADVTVVEPSEIEVPPIE
jgi:RHS repeat-associated protein